MPILMPMHAYAMLIIVHSYEVYLPYRTCMHDSIVICMHVSIAVLIDT